MRRRDFIELVEGTVALPSAARRNEGARMTTSELSNGNWTLPAARNKTKVDLIRPLSEEAIVPTDQIVSYDPKTGVQR